MGSKGQSTTQQSQTQTYTPNPQATGAITSALGQAQNAASQPFNLPVAPVAGFSPDQLAAFNTVNNAQGMALPYINQGANYFQQSAAGPNVSQFFNPFASAVTSNLNDIFGQQTSQNNANLVQAAGGVGADRIAVGQSELAKQQGLTAGQTLANLYQPSLSAALQEQNVLQGAGYGMAALGPAAQNSVLSGAQAQLGTGGLQQQQQQAQLNAPYQWQVAQQAYPFQTAQFLAGITGSLAPGLGGTTSGYGTGTSTPAQPSMWSQILGGAGVGTALLGGSGAFGGNGWLTGSGPAYGGGSALGGDAYGGSGANPLPGLTAADYGAGFARGGSANPYAVPETMNFTRSPDGVYGFDDGGTVSDQPIDIVGHSIVPAEQLHPIQTQQPHLNFNLSAPQQSQQSSGPGLGDIAKLAMMFVNRGGRIDPKKFDGYNPYGFADGGVPDDDVINPDEPYRLAGPEAMDEWRKGSDAAMAFAPTASAASRLPRAVAAGPQSASPAGEASQVSSPYSASPAAPAEAAPERDTSFAASPWAALLSASLGTMAGTSPFAGANIGQGGLQGLKTIEQQRQDAQKDTTIQQAAKRLAQEAKFHEDQYARMTPYQKAQVEAHQKAAEFQQMQPVKVGTDVLGRDIYAKKDPVSGKYINIMTGKPVDEPSVESPGYRLPGPTSANPDAELPPNAQPTSGEAPSAADPTFLQTLDPAIASQVKAVAEGRRALNPRSKEDQALMRLVGQYDPSFDLVNYNSRSKARQDFTSGKSAQNVTSFNTAIGHLGTLDKAIDKLKNSDFPSYNSVSNWLANETGDKDFQKARADFQNSKTAVTEELTRAFRGTGGNVHDIIEWDKSLNEASSPAALHQAVKTAIELLKSRIESVGDQYNRGMGTTKDPMQFLSKKAQDAIKNLDGDAASKPSAKPDASTRFQQLTGGGMSKADAYAKMHEEGY